MSYRAMALILAALAPIATAGCNDPDTSGAGGSGGSGGSDPGTEVKADETHTAGPIQVESGQDITVCTYVRSESDVDQDITAFVTSQSKGGHHLIVYTIDHAVDAEPHLCPQGGQPSWTQVLATQLEEEEIRFPEGVGFRVKAHQQYVMETHFLNATDAALAVESKFGVAYAAPGTVKERAATYFFGTMNIDIPPMSSVSASAECHPPKAMTLHTMFGHQHRMGTRLAVSRGAGEKGEGVYESTDWENPLIASFDGGIDVTPEDILRVECDWKNSSDKTLRYPHEMCFAIGYYWPADTGIFCTNGGQTDTCQCREQGSLDTGPGGAAVQISVTRKAEIAGSVGDLDEGAPIYCALYRADDYGPSGPKEGAEPYYFRDAVDVPLAAEGDAASLEILDVTPGDYKVSCFMDSIGGGFVPGKGDVANLTAPKVTLTKGDVAKVDVVLNIAIP